jgi:hypothetical protein
MDKETIKKIKNLLNLKKEESDVDLIEAKLNKLLDSVLI